MSDEHKGLSQDELDAQEATALPDKEVVSIIDLNADLDLAIDAAAPIDLAVAANANIAAPIDAAVGANVLSTGSEAQALSDQGVLLNQGITADANAHAVQDSGLDQSNDVTGTTGDTTGTTGDTTGTTVSDPGATVGDATSGDLLDVNVNIDGDTDIAAPINGAVAANANVAAPINAGVAANIGSIDSDAIAVAEQDAIINQNIEGEATADAGQTSDIEQ